MTDLIGDALLLLYRFERAQTTDYPHATRLRRRDGGLEIGLVSGESISVRLPCSQDDLETQFRAVRPEVQSAASGGALAESAETTLQSWYELHYDLGAFGWLLQEFSPGLLLSEVELAGDTARVTVTDGKTSGTIAVPLATGSAVHGGVAEFVAVAFAERSDSMKFEPLE